jgi:hypothetical protein
MSQAIRQNELFAAEDWKVIYRAFSDVNFNAYDFDSIRESMLQYIRLNFPEDFNDWIESSEFIALIDLLAYLGQSLAFRMDLNSRENFIDTAERRESILRLARLISYNPRRNLPATGLVKIQQVMTDESLFDSNGVNLANTPVVWNDADNPDWLERFILVVNAASAKTNPFGRPVASGTVGSVKTQIYELNNSPIARGVFSYTGYANAGSFPFELVNADFTDGQSFFERSPDPQSAFRLIYRNDGRGNQSSNTGFFMMFRQGTLGYQDFQLDIPMENRLLDLDIDDINDQDVWVQEIDERGSLLTEWTKVPAVVGNNIIHNSLSRSVRDIYQVNTRERDQISIRFADGRFGNVPTGTFRVWYRQSAGRHLDIHPKDMSGLTVVVPYVNSRGEPHNLALQYSLEYTVRNAQPRESVEAIKRRAPQVYYTQNRMVNGEDYNVFPLSTNRALKVKAVNRTYSGHSRHIDLNDPTGSYQNTNVIGDDGFLYREFENNFTEEPLPTSKDASEIIQDRIVPLLHDPELSNFFFWYVTSLAEERQIDSLTREVTRVPFQPRFHNVETQVRWWRASNALFSSTGLLGSGATVPRTVGPALFSPDTPLHYVTEGATLRFEKSGWATVQSVVGNGTVLATNGPGPIVLNQAVQDGDRLQYVIPAFRTTLTTEEIDLISAEIQNNSSFGLGYNFTERRWQVIQSVYLDETSPYNHVWDYNFRTDSSWLIKVIRTASAWQITSRGMQYVFESKDDVRFFFLNRYKTVDLGTSMEVRDQVKVLRVNPQPGQPADPTLTRSLGRDMTFAITDTYRYEEGYVEQRRVKVTPYDSDDDGHADNPLAFDEVVFPGRLDQPWNTTGLPQPDGVGTAGLLGSWTYLCFWQRYTDLEGYEYYRPLVRDRDILNIDAAEYGWTLAKWQVGQIGYTIQGLDITGLPAAQIPPGLTQSVPPGSFVVIGLNEITPETSDLAFAVVTDTREYMVREGRSLTWDRLDLEEEGLLFQWKHFAPVDHRIDAAVTNIIDLFVLTNEYYREIQEWLQQGAITAKFPSPPTPEDLHITFAELNGYKSASDEMIWHPVKFRTLFGDSAPEELRAKFQVVRLPNSTLSENEIKSRVIKGINEFFDVKNWDFGETFYYTELATYLHQNLATEIASVTIVPLNEEAKFGTLFQIRAEPDEIFLSTARVSDVQVVRNYTQTNLRIGN